MALSDEARALRNSRPLVLNLPPPELEVEVLARIVGDGLLLGTARAERGSKLNEDCFDAICVIMANVFRQRFSDPKRYVAVSMASGTYRGGISYNAWKRTVDYLVAHGWIEFKKGFYDRASGRRFRSRIRGTEHLIEVGLQVGIQPNLLRPYPVHALVELRDTKENGGEILPWPSDPVDRQALAVMESNLKRINMALAEVFIALHVPDLVISQISAALQRTQPERSWVDFYNRFLCRIFNDGNTKLGGRFFGGWWQQIPREYRKFIHLAAPGEEPLWTVEVDFRGVQPAILYARIGQIPPQDCYAIHPYIRPIGAARDCLKAALMCLLNSSSEIEAEQALRNEVRKSFYTSWYRRHPESECPKMTIRQMLPEGLPDVPEMLDTLSRVHAPIARYFYQGVGKELMFTESAIAERIMISLLDRGIVVLPIHDSFLVRKGAQGSLRDAMNEAFEFVTGASCGLKEDVTELDDYRNREDQWRDDVTVEEMANIIRDEDRSTGLYWEVRSDWEQMQNSGREAIAEARRADRR
ncbi:MAG: hypothetical protein JSR73_14135 [Proteobacteria bacterium]|nr:hypothetical protein [Pseudomonadota bacterium]